MKSNIKLTANVCYRFRHIWTKVYFMLPLRERYVCTVYLIKSSSLKRISLFAAAKVCLPIFAIGDCYQAVDFILI